MVDPDDQEDEGLSMQDLVEGLLSHCAAPRAPAMLSANVVWRPATDVYETDESIIIRMDVAGMRRDSFEIIVDGGDVLVRGHRKDPTPAGKKHFHKMEINVGPFERRIRIPVSFDRRKVAATYDNGFLEVKIGKTSRPPPKKIRVEIE